MAYKSKRLCSGCGAIVQGRCPTCTKARHKVYNTDRDNNGIYGTRAWQIARKSALYRDAALCQICKEANATEVDHIVEIRDGGAPYDLNNLQSLCHRCHMKKTAEEAKKRQ